MSDAAGTGRKSLKRLPATALGPLLGRGRKADVHALGPDRVVKIFKPTHSLRRIRREFDNTRAAAAGGVRAWRVDEIVRIGRRLAIVGERVVGETYADALLGGRVTPKQALEALVSAHRSVAALHVAEHVAGPGKPAARTLGPLAVDSRLISPRGFRHGDLSLENLMIGADGATTILDWGSSSYGPLLTDVVISNRALRRTLRRRRTPLRLRAAAPALILAHRWLAFRAVGLPLTRFLVTSRAWRAPRRVPANA